MKMEDVVRRGIEDGVKMWLGDSVLSEVVWDDLKLYIIKPPRCLRAEVSFDEFIGKLDIILATFCVHFGRRLEHLKRKKERDIFEEQKIEVLEQIVLRLNKVIEEVQGISKFLKKLRELERH